jgi:hypothetical protein
MVPSSLAPRAAYGAPEMRARRLYRLSLLALVAVAFALQPALATAIARDAARAAACCCPDPRTCPCHDHGDATDAGIRPCGSSEPGALPVAAPALVPAPWTPRLVAPIAVDAPLGHRGVGPAERPTRPVTPPF